LFDGLQLVPTQAAPQTPPFNGSTKNSSPMAILHNIQNLKNAESSGILSHAFPVHPSNNNKKVFEDFST
jgi:hypothetical protein